MFDKYKKNYFFQMLLKHRNSLISYYIIFPNYTEYLMKCIIIPSEYNNIIMLLA